jgi:excisionase family DNA binding protein
MKHLTLGEAAKMTGKSKPTISKAVKDGRISGQKVDGVFQIEVSELLRVYPAKSDTEAEATQSSNKFEAAAIAELTIKHLKEKLQAHENRMLKIEQERDQAIDDARLDRARFMALLENQQPKGFWSLFTRK